MPETFVTGSTGLIGAAFVSRNDATAAHRRKRRMFIDDTPEVWYDLDDTDIPDEYLASYDTLVHLAADTDVHGGDDHATFRRNGAAASRLWQIAIDSGVEHVVFASSYHVYAGDGRLTENRQTDGTSSAYAAGKLAAENQLQVQAPDDMTTTILRFPIVYGPWATPGQVIPDLIEKGYEGCVDPHPGNPARDFLYVKDAVRAIELALDHDLDGIYNVGTGAPTRIHDVARWIAAELGVDMELRGEDESVVCLDPAKFREATGWRPRVDPKSGIEETVKRYQAYADPANSRVL